MDVINSIEDFPEKERPIALTIGTFDGIHLGHQSVLKRLLEIAKKHQALSVVLTFSNHPSTVLNPENPTSLLNTITQKLELFEEMGIDIVILLEFTEEFSKQTASLFLKNLQNAMNLKFLVLGHDSTLGKDKKGDAALVKDFADQNYFSVEYLKERLINGQPVSSSKIRELIKKGEFREAETLLGRKYSLKLPVHSGKGLGKQIGFSTANLNVQGLTIPPTGVYSVWLKVNGKVYESVANLGFAPTVRGSSYPELEVHVIDKNINLNENEVEVIFLRFIRNEKKFASIDDLTKQIALDIETAKSNFQSGQS